MLKFIVLGLLKSTSATGYDIKKLIENGVGVFYKASYGTLYPLLNRLEKENLISSTEHKVGKRIKRYYSILSAGEKIFDEWLCSPVKTTDGNNTHLAKIYFFDQLDDTTRTTLISLYEENNKKYLDGLYQLADKFRSLENKECFYYKLSTLYYGITIVQEVIRWCQHIKDKKDLDLLIKERK